MFVLFCRFRQKRNLVRQNKAQLINFTVNDEKNLLVNLV